MLPSIFGENLLDEFFDEPWEKSLFGARNPLYGKHAKNLMISVFLRCFEYSCK